MKMGRSGTCLAALALALTAGVLAAAPSGIALAAGGRVYYVAPGGTATCPPSPPNKPFGTIQAALDCASMDGTTPSNPDTIIIAAGTYFENLTIDADVKMDGAGQGSTVINGGGVHTTVSNYYHTVTMNNLTITGGNAAGPNFSGGGIFNVAGHITVTDVTVSYNTATSGGGIFGDAGTMTIKDSTVTHNTVVSYGGGIYGDGTFTVANSTVSYNSASGGNGGGIVNFIRMALSNVIVSNNSAGTGGGIDNYGTLTLLNGVVSWNTAGEGGGIATHHSYPASSLTIDGTHVMKNKATYNGGGILTEGSSAPLTLQGAVVTQNTAGTDGGGIYDNGDDTCHTGITIIGGSITNNHPDDCS